MSDQQQRKNWFARHKVLTVILALFAIMIIAGAAGSGSQSSNNSGSNTASSSKSNNAQKQYRFTDRADKQAKDVELLPNETGSVGGVKLTLTNVKYATSLSDYEKANQGKTYVIADVQIENTSDRTQPYNTFDFRIQTAGGQVLDGTIATTITPLNSGDLVAGGKVTGQVAFEVPVEEGRQYVIWKPGFSSDRAIVQVK